MLPWFPAQVIPPVIGAQLRLQKNLGVPKPKTLAEVAASPALYAASP